MSELQHVNESHALRAFGTRPRGDSAGAEQSPVVRALERLFQEIHTYLEFVAIARGR
jgi:hypothetical protein